MTYRCVCFALSLLPLSFLRLCFFAWDTFPDIPFLNLTCFHFWLFGSPVLHMPIICFHVWCFLLSVFLGVFLCFLVGFVWFSSHCCFHLSFLFWSFLSLFFCWVLLGFCSVCCFGFKEKGVFPAVLVFFFLGGGRVVQYQFWSGCSEDKKWKKKTQEKPKIPPKNELFKYQSKYPFFWGGRVQNFPFSTTWPKKRAPQKNTIKIGVSANHCWKNRCASRNGHFWTQKPKSRNSSYHFLAFFFSFNNTKQKKCWIPNFYSVLATWENSKI